MNQLLLYMFIYRTLIILAGILCIYFGYKLFYVVTVKQGEFKVQTGEKYNVSLKDAAPGTFFALFGAGIIIFSLFNGITITPDDMLNYSALENHGHGAAKFQMEAPEPK